MAKRVISVEILGDADSLVRASAKGRLALASLGDGADRQSGALGRLNMALGGTSNGTKSFASAIDVVKWPAFIAGAGMAASAAGAAGAGIMALGGALAPLAGLGAVAASGLLAAAQAAGTLKLATAGISGALKEQLTNQSAVAPAAVDSSQQQVAAARAVSNAEEGVRTAKLAVVKAQEGVQAAARGEKRAAEDVKRAKDDEVRASKSLQEALRDERMAVRELTNAREAGRRSLEDMNDAMADAQRSAARATLDLQDAQDELNATLADPASTERDRQKALLDVADATNSLSDAQRDMSRQTEDTNKANKAGVEGTEEVKSARDAIVDASKGVEDAERSLAEAHRGVRDAQQGARDAALASTDAQRSLAEAQRGVQKALQGVSDAQAAQAASAQKSAVATADMNKAFNDLPPAAQSFVRLLISLKPKLDELRATAAAGLFPGVEDGLRSVMRNFDPLNRVVGVTSLALGGLAREAGELVGSAGFGRDFESIGRNNAAAMTAVGRGAISAGDAMRHVLVAAQPLTLWTARLTESWGRQLAVAAKTGRETGALAEFFEKTRAVTERLVGIAGSLATALFNIGAAGAPLGNELLASIQKNAKVFADWTGSASGKNAIADFFERARAPLFELGRLLVDVTRSFGAMSTSMNVGPMIQQFRTELLPVLTQVVVSTTKAFGPALISALVQLGKLFATFAGSSGPLVLFVKAITAAAAGLNGLIRAVPGLGPLLVTLTSIAAIVKAVGFASWISGILGMGRGIAALRAIVLGVVASTNMWTVSLAANTVGLVASRIAQVAVTAASRAWAVAQWALNVALTANPIGLVIVAVAGLAAGLIYAYKHSAAFRSIVTVAFNAIKSVAQAVFPVIKKMAEFGLLGPIGLIISHWRDGQQVLSSIWGAIKSAAQTIWNGIKDVIVNPVKSALSWIREAFSDAKRWIGEAWGSVKNAISSVSNGIKDALTSPFRAAWSAIRPIISSITSAINSVKDAASSIAHVVPGFAQGGTVAAASGGVLARVGELGPENVVLPVGSYVQQASQSRGAGGGGQTINFYGPVGSSQAARVFADRAAYRLAFG